MRKSLVVMIASVLIASFFCTQAFAGTYFYTNPSSYSTPYGPVKAQMYLYKYFSTSANKYRYIVKKTYALNGTRCYGTVQSKVYLSGALLPRWTSSTISVTDKYNVWLTTGSPEVTFDAGQTIDLRNNFSLNPGGGYKSYSVTNRYKCPTS